MISTNQKVVLITGCSSGFGYLSALLFAEKGWTVYGTLRDITGESAKELQTKGVHVLSMDITKEIDIHDAVSQIQNESGRIDVLVNNAGVGFLGPVEDFSTQEIRDQFEVNFFGVHQLIKAILPLMRAQNAGRIINISSMAGRSTTALYGVYSATKFALEGMSEALNLEVSKWNISVSLVEPGSFATKFGASIKLPTASTDTSPYTKLLDYNKNLRAKLDGNRKLLNGLRNPQRVAKLIFRIANTRKPKLRYPIGLDAWGVLLATKIVPYRLLLLLLRNIYKW